MPHPRGLGDRPPRLRQWAEGLQILASLVVMGAAIYAAIWAANVFAEISRGLKQDRLSHEHKPRQHRLCWLTPRWTIFQQAFLLQYATKMISVV